MKLFIDIDGVLLNFEHAFVRYLNQEYGLELPENYETDTFEFDAVLGPNGIDEAWSKFLSAPDAGMLNPYVEAERFNAWADGHTVHLLTNFPQEHMAKREENLARLGFKYHSLHHCGFHAFDHVPMTKGQMVDKLLPPGEEGLFVDDHPENCLDVRKHRPEVEVWLMTRRFNHQFSHPQVSRAKDWNCVFNKPSANPQNHNILPRVQSQRHK